ncbi:MAG: LptE family protein [Chlorobiaceae bacterium]|nr:LptE family protein [Chlorobiaceae bacterium]
MRAINWKTGRVLLLALTCMLSVTLQGCYSFSGASIPPHLGKVAVPLFDDASQAGIAQFREIITRKVTDKIEAQSSLTIEADPTRADAVLTGVILSYSDEPSQLGSTSERAVTNRITIVVKGDFEDRVKNTVLFSQSFVGFSDYAVGNYSAQQAAIANAMDQAADALFNRMVSNW